MADSKSVSAVPRGAARMPVLLPMKCKFDESNKQSRRWTNDLVWIEEYRRPSIDLCSARAGGGTGSGDRGAHPGGVVERRPAGKWSGLSHREWIARDSDRVRRHHGGLKRSRGSELDGETEGGEYSHPHLLVDDQLSRLLFPNRAAGNRRLHCGSTIAGDLLAEGQRRDTGLPRPFHIWLFGYAACLSPDAPRVHISRGVR